MVSSTSGAPRAHKHVAAAGCREVGEVAVAGREYSTRAHGHFIACARAQALVRMVRYGPHPAILRASPYDITGLALVTGLSLRLKRSSLDGSLSEEVGSGHCLPCVRFRGFDTSPTLGEGVAGSDHLPKGIRGIPTNNDVRP